MKNLLTAVLLLTIPALSFAQHDLEKKTLIGDKLEMLVPQSFHTMTEAEYKIKYPNPKRKASLILTDENLEVNMIVDHLVQYTLPTEQIEAFRDQQLALIQSKTPGTQLLSTGVKNSHSKKIAYFKLMTTALDQKVFTYFAFTNLEDKILLLSFNCTEKQQQTWEKSFDAMLDSFKELK